MQISGAAEGRLSDDVSSVSHVAFPYTENWLDENDKLSRAVV